MTRFRFRLASVLKLREAARDERRAELAGLRGEWRAAAGPGVVDVDRLLDGQRYELLLRAYRRQIDAQRSMLAPEIERRRQAVVQANREVRVLEKLRDRQAQRHRAEEERQLTKQLDEIAQQRAVRENML